VPREQKRGKKKGKKQLRALQFPTKRIELGHYEVNRIIQAAEVNNRGRYIAKLDNKQSKRHKIAKTRN
jgi:hypothetical protein